MVVYLNIFNFMDLGIQIRPYTNILEIKDCEKLKHKRCRINRYFLNYAEMENTCLNVFVTKLYYSL